MTFSCRCSQECEQRVYWFTMSPLRDCFSNGEPCGCGCHARQDLFAATRKRWLGADGMYHPLAYTGKKVPPRAGV